MSTAYGSNSDRLKKALENRNRPRLNKAQSSLMLGNGNGNCNGSVSSRESVHSMALSDCSDTQLSPFSADMASMIPFITNNTASGHGSSMSVSLGRRASITTNSTASSYGPNSLANQLKSPRRLFEKSQNIDDSPSIVLTAGATSTEGVPTKQNVIYEPPQYNYAPATPVDPRTNEVAFCDEMGSSTEIFLPLRVQALNLDLDNVLRNALVQTMDTSSSSAASSFPDSPDTLSTTSSAAGGARVLIHDYYDYDVQQHSAGGMASGLGLLNEEFEKMARKTPADMMLALPQEKKPAGKLSKVKRLAKKISA
ncbi:hypothetical protein TRVA0_033S00628 [Trichomonascus vanleenenianus]|uniref:uncharacterized protein n=1 Tax=Trichomonascus vanleenenianus TaxID=2268995 RepID=UPI003ECA732F